MQRGASAAQDARYTDKMEVLLKTKKFASILSKPVNIKKVNLDVMRPWITDQITTILGLEDDVVIEYVISLLESEKNAKNIQIKLTGFLEAKTAEFMRQLWTLLLSAQESVGGIPQVFMDQKKKELMIQKVYLI